ncbi:DUF1566 domain-containing protein [bacterium]|nr:DUF1566 domain-containing protein [bacterium]MBU1989663.1 DUF1566 domain-containing protein [bacterium]
MKLLLILLSLLAVNANAGFFGSLVGGAIGSSGGRSGGSNISVQDSFVMEKKVQHALDFQGYYSGEFDGNLNTFDSRNAIENFQKNNALDTDGILHNMTALNLVYLFELADEFNALKFNETKDIQASIQKVIERKKLLLQATKGLEKGFSKGSSVNTKVSVSMNNAIAKEEEFYNDVKVMFSSLDENGTGNIKIDKEKNIIWQDTKFSETEKFEFNEAASYCAELNLEKLAYWRLPSKEELKSLYRNRINFTNNPAQNNSNARTYFRFDEQYVIDLEKQEIRSAYNNYGAYVRCVHPLN